MSDNVRAVGSGSEPGRVVSVIGPRTDYIERVVQGAHTALAFDRSLNDLSPWHDIVGIVHAYLDEDGVVIPRAEPPEDGMQRLRVCVLTEGFIPNRRFVAEMQRAEALRWPILYMAESEGIAIPAGCPFSPLVVTNELDTIGEAVRVWVRAAMTESAGTHLHLPESGVLLHPEADVGELEGSLRVINRELIAQLQKNATLMHQLHPRAFEELIAELLGARGYEVILTPFGRDGGRDILAVKRDDLGSFLVYVECKKWDPSNLVGPDVVRALYGVVAADNVTAGVLATTSGFTPGARAFERQVRHRITLRDFFDLSAWLREHRMNV